MYQHKRRTVQSKPLLRNGKQKLEILYQKSKIIVARMTTTRPTAWRMRMTRTTMSMRFCGHHGPLPVSSVVDNNENNNVTRGGKAKGDSDGNGGQEIRMRKKRKMSNGATTPTRRITVTRTTMCMRFCSGLVGLYRFIPWTTTMRRRKAKGKGKPMPMTRKRKRAMLMKPKRR